MRQDKQGFDLQRCLCIHFLPREDGGREGGDGGKKEGRREGGRREGLREEGGAADSVLGGVLSLTLSR